MAASNTTDQRLTIPQNVAYSYENIESDVSLRRPLDVSGMRTSMSSVSNKRNSSKHYYQGKQPKYIYINQKWNYLLTEIV